MTTQDPHPEATGPEPTGATGPDRPVVPANADGRPAELAELVGVLRQVDGLMARATRLVADLDGRRAVSEEGMPIDNALQLHSGWTRSDVNVLLTAADVLDRMPVTAGLFDRGTFSWGHVRALSGRAGRLDRPTRDAIDRHLDDHSHRLGDMEPEQRLWAIDDAIDDHLPQREVERRERDPERHDVLVLAPRLDGTGTGWFDLHAEAFATVTGRIVAEADTPHAPACDLDDSSSGQLPAESRQAKVSRGRQLADALVRVCSTGANGNGSAPARVSMIIDTDRITDTYAAELQTSVASRPPRVVRRAVDRISCDADLEVVLRDGADLLAAHRYQGTIPTATRRAVAARDGGCRFPGCRAPVSWCDVHHVIERARHRDHDLSNVVLLCRRHHTVVHRGGWRQHLSPDGRYRLTRRARSWTTLPRREQSLPPPTDARHTARRSRPPRGGPHPDHDHSDHRRGPPPDHPEPVPF